MTQQWQSNRFYTRTQQIKGNFSLVVLETKVGIETETIPRADLMGAVGIDLLEFLIKSLY